MIKVINPCSGEVIATRQSATAETLRAAVHRATQAQALWQRTPLDERETVLESYAASLTARKEPVAETISRETGKPLWESRQEVAAMAAKVAISIRAHHERTRDMERGGAWTRFRPLGLCAVVGPFNFPGHLPNGHCVPALLAGNAVLLKPSEKTPLTAEWMETLLREAGLPEGLFQVLHGEGDTAKALIHHEAVRGVFFTGSHAVGLKIQQGLAHRTDKLLALEMGGNNPLVFESAHDLGEAARLIAFSAFVTTGQRCTCARRLYLPKGKLGDSVLSELIEVTGRLRCGDPFTGPEPFMGPVISPQAADAVMAGQEKRIAQGATVHREAVRGDPQTGWVRPGICERPQGTHADDDELFGPLLTVFRYSDIEEAIRACNQTRFGLAAGLISSSRSVYQLFQDNIKAGIINWNKPLTGASSQAAFGGIGASGNFRPGAYHAADYCSYAVASMEAPKGLEPLNLKGLEKTD